MLQFPIVLLVIITGTPPSLKLLLLITSLLFLNQIMTARGLPVAVQVKLTPSPGVTIVFIGVRIMIGITAMKVHKMHKLQIYNALQTNYGLFNYVHKGIIILCACKHHVSFRKLKV